MRAAAAVAIAAAVALACMVAHDADAATARKLHFTSTYTSYADPSGADGTIAMVLPPSEGTIYVGSLTYASSSPAQVVVLHELRGPPAGQPTWGVPGQGPYAASGLGANATSGSSAFAGTAVLLRGGGPFVATASVDAFARGQPAEIRVETIEVAEGRPAVRLARAEVPVELPLHEGILDEGRVLYAITESSDAELAASLSESQGRPVTHAPPLAALLEEAESGGHEPPRVYAFRNGVKGAGLEGYQNEVFEAGPGDRSYSPASELVYAEWRRNLNPEVLASAEEVERAVADGRVSLEEPGIVLNLPPVSWPGGEIPLAGQARGAGDAGAADTGEENGDAKGAGSGGTANGDGGENGHAEGAGTDDQGENSGAGSGGTANGDGGENGHAEGAGTDDQGEDSGAGSGTANGDDGDDKEGEDSGAGSGDDKEEAEDPGEPGAGKETDVVVPEAHQVSEVSVEEMTATFIARRAWGPDGQTIYHIMAGAAPPGPARVTGTADARGMQNYTATGAVADLHYFRGGLAGDGALGSQPSVAGAVPGDEGYSPLWRVHVVEWADADAAALVETRADIDHLAGAGEVTVSAARPLGLDLVVNAPVVDPFWEPGQDG